MAKFTPGTYHEEAQGFLDMVEVDVKVSEDKIEDIQVSEADSENVGSLAIKHLVKQMLDQQTADVDVLSGATHSSEGLINAVREALRIAAGQPEPDEFTPGTYYGEGDGYKGKVSLAVTVDENEITDIKYRGIETPELGGQASEKLIQQIKEDGSKREFDVVSGATYTTMGMQYALDRALAYARGDEDPDAEPYSFQTDTRVDFGTGWLTLDEVQAILDNLEVEISFVDKQNRFLYYNKRRHQEDAGTPRSPVTLGGNVSDCHPPQIRTKVEGIMEDLHHGRRRSESMWYTKGNGNKVYLHYRPIYDQKGRYLGVLETVQNGKPFIDTAESSWDRTLHDPHVPNPFLGETAEDVNQWYQERYEGGLDDELQHAIEKPYIEASEGGARSDSVTKATTKAKDKEETESKDAVSGASQHEHKMPNPMPQEEIERGRDSVSGPTAPH
ncbi:MULTISPECIES: FMN-binding protein [Aerococcus]|nr:FMN-binding protein [Aerococcus urinae]MDK6597494.1 FMN-binding protein [Aerococcus urinae]MDK7303250.1 FMN-binding protein [Aerococcus urinae]MDK7802226.1 FMN-binding protein [Aerococcus urinae]MDK8655812.1 FMN-binding protein [Aerococcus urinae]